MGATPVVLLNGPSLREAGFNADHGAMGSGKRANVSVGRALKLLLQNVGGARLGGTEVPPPSLSVSCGFLCLELTGRGSA